MQIVYNNYIQMFFLKVHLGITNKKERKNCYLLCINFVGLVSIHHRHIDCIVAVVAGLYYNQLNFELIFEYLPVIFEYIYENL